MISAFLLDTSTLGNQDITLPGNARIRLPTRTQRSATPARKPSNSRTMCMFPQHTNSNDVLGLLGDQMVPHEHLDASRNVSSSSRSKLWCDPPHTPESKMRNYTHISQGVCGISPSERVMESSSNESLINVLFYTFATPTPPAGVGNAVASITTVLLSETRISWTSCWPWPRNSRCLNYWEI